MNTLTYSNDKKLKNAFLAEIVKHRKLDMIAQGTYGTQNGHWKGCAVACSLRSLDIVRGRKTATEYGHHTECMQKNYFVF